MTRSLDIALLQTRPRARFAEALDEALPLAEAAVQAGADMIFLPEYCGGLATRDGLLDPPHAPEVVHPVLTRLMEFAAKAKVWMQIGSVAIEGPGGKVLNRGYMVDDRGKIRGRYDKIHLFDVDLGPGESYRESSVVVPGGRVVVHDTPFAAIGHSICYDLRFPQLYRHLAQEGAEILTCPAAFTRTTGEAHWHVLNRARAIENTSFMVSACAIGAIPGGGESYGHSLVVSPWGEVIADGGALPGVVHARLDLDRVAEARAKVPSLTHDRPFKLPDGQRHVA